MNIAYNILMQKLSLILITIFVIGGIYYTLNTYSTDILPPKPTTYENQYLKITLPNG